eukprot:353299-Chlamydomonas_euryale.AAC.7
MFDARELGTPQHSYPLLDCLDRHARANGRIDRREDLAAGAVASRLYLTEARSKCLLANPSVAAQEVISDTGSSLPPLRRYLLQLAVAWLLYRAGACRCRLRAAHAHAPVRQRRRTSCSCAEDDVTVTASHVQLTRWPADVYVTASSAATSAYTYFCCLCDGTCCAAEV